MTDFLLELRCEEIPARMQAGARADLEKLFRREMDAAGVGVGEVTVWSTPRRLALIARNLPEITKATREELKGPPVGAPNAAIDGFCRKNNIRREDLEVHNVKGRDTYLWIRETEGRNTKDVLGIAIRWIVEEFSWPKSMRWGAASLSTESPRWVRPLSGIVAILGDELVECEVAGITSGFATLGHRFHHPGEITIGGAGDYQEKLRACHVIVDHAEREALIRDGAAQAAADAGLALVEDEGLVIENAGLTEWPVPLLGRFDEAFLEVPPEVIQLTARVNQKYFVCEADGKLANAFICTANIEASDGGAAIVDGNRKVLAARLSDARFFWEQDRKTSLADHAQKLERITFHEKLGTVADKVERVAKLARWLVESDVVVPAEAGTALGNTQHGGGAQPHEIPASAGMTKERLATLAEQAARLCKADLVTEMVGEFPELQGLMGGYYARAERLPDEVADAIRDHYKPVGQGDDVPTAPVTVAVSLADKLDTIFQFFQIGEVPNGSKDPFALRRSALAVISMTLTQHLRWSIIHCGVIGLLGTLYERRRLEAATPFENMLDSLVLLADRENSKEVLHAVGAVLKTMPRVDRPNPEVLGEAILTSARIRDFFLDRLEVICRTQGVPVDLIRASIVIDGDRGKEDDLVRLLARVNALQSFIATEDGANLLAGYKRAANILKKEDWPTPTVTPAEAGVDRGAGADGEIDSGLRRNDDEGDEPPHTGEEDPFALADDPDLGPAMRAAMQQGLSYTPEPAEQALIDALDAAEPRAAAAIEAEDFAGAMAALASLRAPIDRFFDDVTVNDADPAKREARLDLLARFRAAVHNVADFSRIEG